MLGQAISASLKRLQLQDGGKALAPLFDGRDGKAVAETTVFQHLASRMTAPADLLRGLPPKVAAEVAKVQERLVLEQVAPGRWGRR
jgi:hypothetical protein